jgi:hypothetical protein
VINEEQLDAIHKGSVPATDAKMREVGTLRVLNCLDGEQIRAAGAGWRLKENRVLSRPERILAASRTREITSARSAEWILVATPTATAAASAVPVAVAIK